jgi:DNA invertase Pin-like site-specific DNA recombinase
MTRTAIYARVSTRDKGQETQNQLRQLREFCAREQWQIASEYVDHETGSTSDRSEFQRMFEDASRRKFDVVLFWALDRLSREGTLETLQHLNRLSAYGIGFRSFTEAYLDSCGVWKDAIVGILATLAKQERIRLSQRVKAGLDRARAQGKRIGRPGVAVNASQIASLRDQGRSWRQIADALKVSVRSARRACGKIVVRREAASATESATA